MAVRLGIRQALFFQEELESVQNSCQIRDVFLFMAYMPNYLFVYGIKSSLFSCLWHYDKIVCYILNTKRNTRISSQNKSAIFILARNEDMHKISDEFEFWPELTTGYGVSCP